MVYLRTAFDVGLTGNMHNGSEEADEAALQRPEMRRIDIGSMCTVLHKGGQFSLAKADDATAIYELVTKHLDGFVELSKQRYNIELPPIEQLAALDTLAVHLYPMYLRYRPDMSPTGTGMRKRSTSLGNTIRLASMPGPATDVANEPDDYTARTPIIMANMKGLVV